MRGRLFLLLCWLTGLPLAGCSLVLPEISLQPVIRNPFPQLGLVAVATFFYHSDEPTLDGRVVTMAYFAELQATPGFEVVPLNVVEEAILANRVDLNGPGEARRLAQLLNVDAVIVGAVTDYSPYYPPRIGMHVEWYTANPGYHEIPVGYGLPWNTPEEEFIPDSLVYESQMALARAQMATQAPDCDSSCQALPSPPQDPVDASEPVAINPFESSQIPLAEQTEELPAGNPTPSQAGSDVHSGNKIALDETIVTSQPTDVIGALPPYWPDESCFVPGAPQAIRPACIPHYGPVLKHTSIYHGTDPAVTQALKSYVYFRDDARFGGWKSYLQRSDDFLRFCCHMHISEMLSSRGGSHKTRLVLRWPERR